MAERSTRWSQISHASDGTKYASSFDSLEANGVDVHGEARFCASLVEPGSRILDAGCGTGRVARQLDDWGFECVGVDSDESMLQEALRSASGVDWLLADLAEMDLSEPPLSSPFDLIVAAGNVIPLLAESTEHAVIGTLATLLLPTGLLVAGFGLHPDTLPLDWAPVDLPSYDRWCADHELELIDRFATWDRAPYRDGDYAVSVHRRR